jgi:hemerythrin
VEFHLEFIRKVFEFSQEISVKGTDVQREMLRFLAEWYTNHVLGVDRKYMESLSAKGIK